MKKSNLFYLMWGLLLLSACTDDIEMQEPQMDSQYPIQLYNEIVQTYTTRVNDEGFCNGDEVGIYVVNNENGESGTLQVEGNQVDNTKFTFDEPNGKWIPETPVYFRDKNTHVDIYGYYPLGAPESIEAYNFELSKDQSTSAGNGQPGGYEASDFLWGKSAK